MPSTRSCPAGFPSASSVAVRSRHVVDDLEAQPEVLAVAGERVERRLVDAADHPADAARRARTARRSSPRSPTRSPPPSGSRRTGAGARAPARGTAHRSCRRAGRRHRHRATRRAHDARARRKSPERIATMLLQRALTLGTPRRVSASSITSSWCSEPRWTSSHATPPVTTSSLTGSSPPAAAYAGAQGEGRPDPLAARGDQVRSDLGEEPVVVADRGPQCVLDPLEVTVERRERERLGRIHGSNATARPPGSPTRTDRPESGRNGPFRRSHPTRGARRWVCTAQRRTRRHLLD